MSWQIFVMRAAKVIEWNLYKGENRFKLLHNLLRNWKTLMKEKLTEKKLFFFASWTFRTIKSVSNTDANGKEIFTYVNENEHDLQGPLVLVIRSLRTNPSSPSICATSDFLLNTCILYRSKNFKGKLLLYFCEFSLRWYWEPRIKMSPTLLVLYFYTQSITNIHSDNRSNSLTKQWNFFSFLFYKK